MALFVDRVNAELQLLRKPDDSATDGSRLDLGRLHRDDLARILRPAVVEIIAEHIRDLERRGTL